MIKSVYYILLHKIFFKLKLFVSFIQSFFIIKKITKIEESLILIGQIQRSGGSLLVQLFDSHKNLHTYPNELIISKSRYQLFHRNFYKTLIINEGLRINYIKRNYTKLGKIKPNKILRNPFKFNPSLEKKIFLELKRKFKKKNTNKKRFIFNAYFTSFFNSFLNYKNFKGKKKYIIAFLPKFIFYKNNINLFFKTYPKSFIIIILREPMGWLNSAKIHFDTKNNKDLLKNWNNNFNNSLKLKRKYKKQILLVSFSNLRNNTKRTMHKICKIIKIDYLSSLTTPTFNGHNIQSNSSHKIVHGKIDKNKDSSILKNISNQDKKSLKNLSIKYKKIQKKLI